MRQTQAELQANQEALQQAREESSESCALELSDIIAAEFRKEDGMRRYSKSEVQYFTVSWNKGEKQKAFSEWKKTRTKKDKDTDQSILQEWGKLKDLHPQSANSNQVFDILKDIVDNATLSEERDAIIKNTRGDLRGNF